MRIIYTSKFTRKYKKLPKHIKISAEEKENVFCKDPFHPSLDTHKLHGKFKEFWSFSIGHRHRIIFEFGNKNTIHFHSVGDHNIYQ